MSPNTDAEDRATAVSDPTGPDYNPWSPFYDVTADSSSQYYVGPVANEAASGDDIRARVTAEVDKDIAADSGWLSHVTNPAVRDREIQRRYEQQLAEARERIEHHGELRSPGEAPSTVWSNASHEQMVSAISGNADSATVAESSEEWVRAGNELTEHQNNLADAINADSGNWRGSGGNAAREHMAEVGKWLGTTARGATLTGRQQEIHSQTLNETQKQMAANPPIQFSPQEANARLGQINDPYQFAAQARQDMETYKAQQAARDQAARVMTEFDRTVGSAVATPMFAAPPKLPGSDDGSATGGGAQGNPALTPASRTSPRSSADGRTLARSVADQATPGGNANTQAAAFQSAETGQGPGSTGGNPGGVPGGNPGGVPAGNGTPGGNLGGNGNPGGNPGGVPGGSGGNPGGGGSPSVPRFDPGTGIPGGSAFSQGGSGHSGPPSIPDIGGGGKHDGSTRAAGYHAPPPGSLHQPNIPPIPEGTTRSGSPFSGGPGGIPGANGPGSGIPGIPGSSIPGGSGSLGGSGRGGGPTIGRLGGINGESIGSRLLGGTPGPSGAGSLGGGGAGAGGKGLGGIPGPEGSSAAGGKVGSGGSSSGAGAAAGEGAAGRSAGATAAGGRGAAGSPGAGGMGAGRGGKSEEDKEHSRADFLLEDDDSIFAAEQAVAPPVIGDWKNKDWK